MYFNKRKANIPDKALIAMYDFLKIGRIYQLSTKYQMDFYLIKWPKSIYKYILKSISRVEEHLNVFHDRESVTCVD
jgi:hypothetical protein